LYVEKTTFLNDQFHEILENDLFFKNISKNVPTFEKGSRRLGVKESVENSESPIACKD